MPSKFEGMMILSILGNNEYVWFLLACIIYRILLFMVLVCGLDINLPWAVLEVV